MITQIKFLKDYRKVFTEGETFDFVPGLNLLVGDQGTGKSTIIESLRYCSQPYEHEIKKVISVKTDKQTFLRAFDFERDNPRAKGQLDQRSNELFLFSALSAIMSHGQTAKQIIKQLETLESKPATFVLDEPDMGLSVRSCYELIELFDKLVKEQNHQFIVSAHNPTIINSVSSVLSIEHKRWMTPSEFILTHTPSKKT